MKSKSEQIYEAIGEGYGYNGTKEECIKIIENILNGNKSVCCDAELIKLTTYGYDECIECGKTYRQQTDA